jgi:hypothetical protein
MPISRELRDYCTDRVQELKFQRTSWEAQWRDIAKYQLPQRGEFWRAPNQSNRGDQKTQAILDTQTTFAIRTLKAGLMGGLTSPARPWFRLTLPDQQVSQITSVRAWLDQVSEGMMMIFSDSNIYEVLLLMYQELGVFGTACAILEEDFDDVIRAYPMTIGEYYLSINDRGKVDTMARRFIFSARQCVQRWGEAACGEEIARKVKDNIKEQQVPVWQLIEPRKDYKKGALGPRGKKYRSVYWLEQGREGHYLSDRGYSVWPVLSPRWETVSNDAYGTGPGHQAQPDVRSLQVLAKRRHNAVDKHVNPPMAAPVELQGQPSGTVPGHINYFAGDLGAKMMRPLYQTNPSSFQPLQALIQDTRDIISRTYYADLFLMISQMDGIQPRNQIEIIARKEEKLMMLGPVLDSLRSELLKPLVDYTYETMVKHRLFGAHAPPPEAEGYALEVELISVLAQAQKAARIGSIERVASFVGSLAGANPEVLDKLDMDESIDLMADAMGAPVGVVRGDDEVAKIRAKRAQQMAQQQAMQNGMAIAQGAKTLADTPIGGGRSALQAITGI